MALGESTRGFIGEVLLFLLAAAAFAAAASLLGTFESSTPKEGAVVGTFFTVIAGTLYAGRTYWDEKKWKRFAVTTALAPTLVTLSIFGVAHTIDIELAAAVRGTVNVWTTAAGVLGIVYVLRWIYLVWRWRAKMRIEKCSKSGDYRKAIREAENTKLWPIQRRNYIEDPANFSSCKSAALQLAQSLDTANMPSDATRVRLVANGWTTEQANALIEEQARTLMLTNCDRV